LAATRTLYWTEEYAMPPDARVELNHEGRQYNVRPETIRRLTQPDGGLAHWECDLIGPPRPPASVTR
jgi:hypothetical protein